MKNVKNVILSVVAAALVMGCSSHSDMSNADGVRRVGHVKWHKQKRVDVQRLVDESIPANSAKLFFFRQDDGGHVETSANVAVNERFQVSLQPGHLSRVYSCTGKNDLSVDTTARKSNNLSVNRTAYNLSSGKNYFFEVGVDASGSGSIRPVPADYALNAMQGLSYQSHQISRVVPNCPQGPSRIELKILFDTDKSLIKTFYYDEIKRVSNYMSQYPNTTAVIEGHTDNRASDQYNQALSQRRVDAVRKVLVEHFGVNASRLKAVGYGESRPVATNTTREGRQQNRRVIAVFYNNQSF